jgi:hypothetical protein
MKYRNVLLSSLAILAASAMTAQACWISGCVRCPNGTVAKGVKIVVTESGSTWTGTATTDSEGHYTIQVPEVGGYLACLDVSTLPAGATLQAGQNNCQSLNISNDVKASWTLDGPFCLSGVCWFTGGGALIDPDIGIPVADIKGKNNGKTPDIAFGGNVYPGCSPTAGGGGSWNHVDRTLKLHFHATDIVVVSCGNVAGIPPGSTSPVTPFNYIEFQGVGWLDGIRGNKISKQLVTFYARTEDHNEPGSKGANDGALIDQYYLQVMDSNSQVVIQVGTGNPPSPSNPAGSIGTVPITDGNFQLHISSCDNPPTP